MHKELERLNFGCENITFQVLYAKEIEITIALGLLKGVIFVCMLTRLKANHIYAKCNNITLFHDQVSNKGCH